MPHGNSHQNFEEHHLYEIFDTLEKDVLLVGINGKKRAEEIEQDYIDKYESAHGRRPRGNPKRGA